MLHRSLHTMVGVGSHVRVHKPLWTVLWTYQNVTCSSCC
jgi:hypothetical protein